MSSGTPKSSHKEAFLSPPNPRSLETLLSRAGEYIYALSAPSKKCGMSIDVSRKRDVSPKYVDNEEMFGTSESICSKDAAALICVFWKNLKSITEKLISLFQIHQDINKHLL
jgi:hypothetical protein